MNFDYVIKTLEIEKYRIEGLLRKIIQLEYESMESIPGTERMKEDIKSLNAAIIELERISL